MNIGSRGNKYLSRGGVCALAMALAACGQSQNPAPAGDAATTGSAPTAATAAAPASTAPAGMQPTAVSFPNKYGSLTFPEQFPAGTTLTITQWHHFVPRYDKWFDKYAQEWGQHNNVKVVVQHINLGDLVPTLSAAIAAKKGSDLFEMVSPPASFIQGLQSLDDVNEAAEQAFGKALDVCTSQTYLPIKKQWYGYCHGWVPDPGDYRISLWQKAGYPTGPHSYADLMTGGTKIFKSTGIPVGVGMSPELDSEFYARSLIWSFGGSVFDKCGKVALDSPQVIAAVKYQAQLFKAAETPEVFAWNPASNNQAFISGQASYIQNSISFYRTAQEQNNATAADTGFSPGLQGPTGQVHQTSHVWLIYVMPKYVTNDQSKLAAKKFMLDLTTNASWGTYASELYDFPAYPGQVPQLFAKGGWLDNDPFGSQPADKLNVLRNASEWTAWPGYPGSANPAVSEVYNTHLLSTMMAEVARGNKTPEAAVKSTAAQIQRIVDKWNKLGFVGCAAQ
ncbi:MAG TPA: extracellular solute-binding protein [Rhodanobacteraceae bacterium]|nr:extracellular solute-binding protein [Rhodanobacteraceae bacterium]